MPTKTIKTYKGRRVRLTRLDACGVPQYGAAASVVTDGFVTVTIAEDREAGTVYRQKNAWGEYCINDKDPDLINFADTGITLCGIDPDVMDIVGGAVPHVVGGDVIGWMRTDEANTNAFALEGWVNAGAAQCDGGINEWGYFIVPFLKNGKINGTIQFGQGVLNLALSAEGYPDLGWGEGPYLDNPTLKAGGIPLRTMYGAVVTTVQPPAVTTTGAATLYGPQNAVQPGDIYPPEPTVTAQDSTNAAKLVALGYTPATNVAWAAGEFFTVGTRQFNWSGAAWAAGPHA